MSIAHRSVLLVIADDWSPLAGCYGSRVIQTPHIDRLARRGVVFDRAFCTTPSCAASRANLLTGLYAHTHGQYGHSHGIHGFRTHEHVRSLPRVLKDAGVRSGCVGKTHFAPLGVYPFDVFADVQTLSARDLARGATEFLTQVGDAPFYLHVAPTYPHRHEQGFGADQCTDEFDDVTYDPAEIRVPDWLPDEPEVRQDLANYYQAVSRYDACVGAVLDALESSPRAKDTLVIVTSDHGMPFPGAKASSFESGHHCPLVISAPGGAGGSHNRALVNWTDLMPTILDWLQVPQDRWPKQLAGRSFLSVLTEENPAGWDETYYSHCFHEVSNYFPYRVLRGRRYKFTQNLAAELPNPLPADLFRSPTWSAVRQREIEMMGQRPTARLLHRDREELVDLDADPTESVNLVHEAKHRQIADEMRRKLIDFRIATADPWLEDDYQRGEITAEQHHRSRG